MLVHTKKHLILRRCSWDSRRKETGFKIGHASGQCFILIVTEFQLPVQFSNQFLTVFESPIVYTEPALVLCHDLPSEARRTIVRLGVHNSGFLLLIRRVRHLGAIGIIESSPRFGPHTQHE